MSLVWLTRYIAIICVVLALAFSAITYHPDVQYLGVVIPPICGIAALLCFGVAHFLSRLPTHHWVHQSRTMTVVTTAVAIMMTLLLVLVG